MPTRTARAKREMIAEARKNVAARKAAANKGKAPAKKKKTSTRKSPSLGSGLAEKARRLVSGRRSQIDRAVKRATR